MKPSPAERVTTSASSHAAIFKGTQMTASRRLILFFLPLALLASVSVTKAAPPASWDGTWAGLWDGKDDTSIEIVDNKVIGYSFKGAKQPVETRDVSEKQLAFGTKLFTITLTRTNETTATAQFDSGTMGVAKADLTRR